jgi:hypothetical protein
MIDGGNVGGGLGKGVNGVDALQKELDAFHKFFH